MSIMEVVEILTYQTHLAVYVLHISLHMVKAHSTIVLDNMINLRTHLMSEKVVILKRMLFMNREMFLTSLRIILVANITRKDHLWLITKI